MLTELEMALGLLFEDKTGLTDSYDFLLTQSNLDGLKTSLASYGLKLRESRQMKTFYRLERIDQ